MARPIPDEPPVTRADGIRGSLHRTNEGRRGRATFAWIREERGRGYDSPPPCSTPRRTFLHPCVHSFRDRFADAHLAREGRWLRREVPGGAAREAARRLRPRRLGRAARRPRSRRRRGRVPARRRPRARLHRRLLPARRRRPAGLRRDRGDERAQRRLRDGRGAAARALDHGLPRGAADRDAGRDPRRRGRGRPRGRGDPRRRPHDPRRRAEVRPRRRRHRPPGRNLAEERRPAGRRALPDEAARHGARAPGAARGTRPGGCARRGRGGDAHAQPRRRRRAAARSRRTR